MLMRSLCGGLLVALLLPGVARAAEEPLAEGAEAPMIHIDAFNDDQGAFCVTCQAGRNPAVVAFVRTNNEATQKLLNALDEAYRANKDKKLFAGVVILGDGEAAAALKKYITDQGLKIPAAILAGDSKELPKWKVAADKASQVYFIKGHKIAACAQNLAADKVAGQIERIVG